MRGVYFDLERAEDRLRLDLEWEALVAGRKLAILDEAQSWPEVFTRLRSAIDRDRKRMGRFLLLGSVSPSLMIHVSESLAGRLSIVELTPFLWTELKAKTSLERHWLCGGYPDGGVLQPRRYPRWQLDYLALLAQRDLPRGACRQSRAQRTACCACSRPSTGRHGTPRRSVKAWGSHIRRSTPTSTTW